MYRRCLGFLSCLALAGLWLLLPLVVGVRSATPEEGAPALSRPILMAQMGQKQLVVELTEATGSIPDALSAYDLTRADDGLSLTYQYDTSADRTGITTLLNDVAQAGLVLRDVQTRQSSLEEIFVNLVSGEPE